MTAFIQKTPEDQEYFFEEGCFILELSNSEQEEELSIARARVEPGKTTELHRLKDTIERYVILSGLGEVEIQGLAKTQVQKNDMVFIPAFYTQKITNIGQNDLVFLVICTPRFKKENYQFVSR